MASPLEQFTIKPLILCNLLIRCFHKFVLWMTIAAAQPFFFGYTKICHHSHILSNPSQRACMRLSPTWYVLCWLKTAALFSFIFALFMFVLFGNLLGMIPLSFTFTSHIIVTFALAMFIFVGVVTNWDFSPWPEIYSRFFPWCAPMDSGYFNCIELKIPFYVPSA